MQNDVFVVEAASEVAVVQRDQYFSILSDCKSPKEVQSDLISSWLNFFNGVPADALSEQLTKMKEHISHLHDTRARFLFPSSPVPPQSWYYDPVDILYAQYLSPLHLAAWCGYLDFFAFCGRFPSLRAHFIHSRDILGNLPLHACYFVCDAWLVPLVPLFPPSHPQSDRACPDFICSCRYDAPNALGLLPLHIACIFNQPRGVAQLLAQHVDPQTPVRFFSGDQDPVGSMGAGVRKVEAMFRAAGCREVSVRLYPGGRHEMLNEINRAQVWQDVLDWLEERLDRGGRGGKS